jgi:hypothetical protein
MRLRLRTPFERIGEHYNALMAATFDVSAQSENPGWL